MKISWQSYQEKNANLEKTPQMWNWKLLIKIKIGKQIKSKTEFWLMVRVVNLKPRLWFNSQGTTGLSHHIKKLNLTPQKYKF